MVARRREIISIMKLSLLTLVALSHTPWASWAFTAPTVSRRGSSASSLCSTRSSDDLSKFAAALEEEPKSWQAVMEEFLSPSTSAAKRQVLLQELLNANQEIRASLEMALKDRKVSRIRAWISLLIAESHNLSPPFLQIDPLLTPTGRKLQAGTRAVARQLSTDILPSLARSNRLPVPPPNDLTKVGSRLFSALQNQMQKNLETLQKDLADPARIPKRLEQQTSDLVKEASNVFSDTPVGLKAPTYTVVTTTDDYEIRDYIGYKVATTSMGNAFDVAANGAAFNSLAAYIFGANRQQQTLSMTTPVTTTLGGEMRFYIDAEDVPEPLKQDEGRSVYETGSILIQDIPPARLAVRRFTGFVTEGEVARQKEALLTALRLDGVELDVGHGETVGHVVFQYNPPYTLPMVRRNEIAVAVLNAEDADLEDPWEWEEE